MTDEEILKKALEKAEFTKFGKWRSVSVNIYQLLVLIAFNIDGCASTDAKKNFEQDVRNIIKHDLVNIVIFSHDFAEAFAKYLLSEKQQSVRLAFGEGKLPEIDDVKIWFLRSLVIEKNRLRYIRRFL